MNSLGQRTGAIGPKISFPAMAFRKVLKGFEIGGLPYAEVQFQLKRLLATGASPAELREVLRRTELIEPLPEYAHSEVLGLLDEAIERETAQQSDSEAALEPEAELPPAPELAAELEATRAALESEQARVAEIETELIERAASEQVLRSRLDAALQESERYQSELRAARNSIASRDKVTAQMRLTLDERDTQLASLRRENAEASATLESRTADGVQLEAELQAARTQAAALAAELKSVHAALEAERRKGQEIQRTFAEKGTLSGVVQESSQQAQRELEQTRAQMRQVLAERDAQLTALRQGQAKTVAALEARAKSAEAELQAVPRRVDGAQGERGASKAELDRLHSQIAHLQMKLRDNDALVEKLQAAVRGEAERAAQWQNVAQTRDSDVPLILPQFEAKRPPVAARKPRFGMRGWRWDPRAVPKELWIGAAVVLLAAAAWFLVHHPAAAPTKAAVIPIPQVRPGSIIQDCPTCPTLTVLPTGRFEQGTEAANGSAFEKPPHFVLIAHPIALSTNAVTVDEFRAFVAATGRDMQGCDTYDGSWRHHAENNWENPGFAQTGSHPVTCASWNDAKAYAAWLSAKTGHQYRLPSASEWEYAARAGGTAAQPWSEDGADACASANVADQSAARRYPGWSVFACNDGYVQTSPVASFKANSFGLNDMLGNVFQWTEDCWNANYKGAPIDGSPRMDGDCTERELRGGSWFSTPAYVRANYRNHFGVDYRTSSAGIRVARDVET
jgi:formylglycine-generating enzyme required for sulfatase activity